MATSPKQGLNGTGHGPYPPDGMPAIERDHIRGKTSSDFDIGRSRISMSPAIFWSIMTGSVTIAAVITALAWDTSARIGKVEAGISGLRDEIKAERESTQTRQQAYIDCLETERKNRGFVCPLAKEARVPAPPLTPVSKAPPRKSPQPSPSPFSWLGASN